MKRVASESLNRYDDPVTVPTSQETRSDAIDNPTRQPAGLTIEQLRSLPLPPFPAGFDFMSRSKGDENDELARIAREGLDHEKDYSHVHYYWFLSFCVKHACADALVWFLLHIKDRIVDPECSDLSPQQIRYLIACLNRLPEPVTLFIEHLSHCSGGCWDTVIEELQKSSGIKAIYQRDLCSSEQDLERLLVAIKDHPVICELGININVTNAAVLNHYLGHNSTPRHLTLSYLEPDDISPAPDILPGLMANRTLTELKLCRWLITPALGHILAAPGKALAELEFDCCNFAPGAMAAFASALADNNILSHLALRCCSGISFAELKCLHDGLRFNRSVVSLDDDCMVNTPTPLLSMWEMLQTNLTVCKMSHGLCPVLLTVPDPLRQWSLVPHLKQRVRENKELPSLINHYPMAKLALSILPANLPYLPPDISGHIVRSLLQTDATALPTYRTLHMLALHKAIKEQDKPRFPDHLHLASCLPAQLLAQGGVQALPLPPEVMRSIAMFCIRHKASEALDWLVVHASRGTLDLRRSQFAPGEAGWLIHWTRTAPCHIKLRLDNVPLRKQDIADIAQHPTGNPALTSLSLKGCAMAAEDLQRICEALKANLVMVELLLSEDLIALGRWESDRSQSWATLKGGMVVDGNGNLITVPEQASASSLEDLARYRDGIARNDLFNDVMPFRTPRYLLLAAIAFSLRRNARLQNGVPTPDDFVPDKAFVDAIAILPDPGRTAAIDQAPE